MRRIVPLIAVMLVPGSLFAAAAWARDAQQLEAQASAVQVASRVADPFTAPIAAPQRDAQQQGFVYGYRSGSSIAAELRAASETTQRVEPRAQIAGASITVTATILPGITVRLDQDGNVAKLITNTPQRELRNVMLVLPRALDASTWAQLRVALGGAGAGVGTIWSAG